MPLNKNTPVRDWIRDFQDSDNPKFAGKSKEKRRQMAIAAYMAKKNEEFDEDGELVLIEELGDIDESLLPNSHPLFQAAKAASAHQEIHSVKHAGDSSNGKYANLEVRVKDRTNPNAVRIKKMVVHKATGEATKSTLSQSLTDVRHLNDSVELIYETADLTKLINPFSKTKTTKDRKHFNGLMQIRKLQHDGNYTVSRVGKIEIHTVHGANGKLSVGAWNHETGEGKYIPPMLHDDVEMGVDDVETILENIEVFEVEELDESQSLDELSQQTKDSYAQKAVDDVKKNQKLAKAANVNSKFKEYAAAAIQKRLKGLERVAESEEVLDEAEVRGNLSDIHNHIKSRIEDYLEKHGNSLDHLNKLADIVGAEVSHNKERKITQYSIKNK